MISRPLLRSPLSPVVLGVGQMLRRFSPAVLFSSSEPGVWFDPSDFSTMFQDSAGTTPVTAVEQPVGRIVSKVNGHVATQATSASRPVLKQDAGGRYYLHFDGVDDSLATGSINFTSTDKVTVFAGVHKASDATTAVLLELSADSASSAGSFALFAPRVGNTTRYDSRLRGAATTNDRTTEAGFTAPVTSVLAASFDMAGASGDAQNILRVNGVAGGTAGSLTTASNLGNYPLHIGRRNNASLPFNGRLYGLLVTGRAASASEIAAAERYVNQRTGAYA